jgi:hypothetical protein
VPITIKSAFAFTGPTCAPGEQVVTDMLTGTGAHLGQLTATQP